MKDKKIPGGFIWLVATFIVFIDQISKLIITSHFELLDTITVINNFFYLTYTQNTGAFYSILEGNQIFLILVSLLFLFLFGYYIMKEEKRSKISFLSYSFLIGGVIGNLIDRVMHHYVIDFLSFHIFSYYFPIFNVADIFIVVGFCLIVFEEVYDFYGKGNCRRR